MEERRLHKFKKVASLRQPDLTVILENVWDTHNVGAVLRSCDAVGIAEIYVLNTNPEMVKRQLTIGKRTSGGSTKWIEVHYYTDASTCFKLVKKKYGRVFGTHLSQDSIELYEMNLTEPIALVFGNESLGITAETLKYCDGNFIIPQVGMAQSLNISVACAVTLYEAYRQRNSKGLYVEELIEGDMERAAIFKEYISKHENRMKPKRSFYPED